MNKRGANYENNSLNLVKYLDFDKLNELYSSGGSSGVKTMKHLRSSR